MARTPILLLSACLLAAPAGARGQDCADAFADGRRPDIVNPKLTERAVPLCYDAFALLHSGVSRTPLYAAEHLTRASVAAARRVDRVDAFHDEDALPTARVWKITSTAVTTVATWRRPATCPRARRRHSPSASPTSYRRTGP
jgi:DNA/RNA endonuclease G (NUC1)